MRKRLICVFLFLLYMPAIAEVSGIVTNEGTYPNNEVPKYKKFEVTFLYDSPAENPQLPYDASPPAGLRPETGVSVDGLFTPDNWTTTYSQPGFYYKDFTYAVKGNADWWYPTGEYYWKIRFTPDQTGTWKYKIRTQDSSGTNETEELSFVVCASNEKGFLKVSDTDERYFEFENGEHFIGLGHNLRFRQISWDNPVRANTTLFTTLNNNGTQLFRTWLSHWSIYGSAWNPWQSPLNQLHALDPPWEGLSSFYSDPNSEVSLRLTWSGRPAVFMGWSTCKKPPIKRNTDYHFSVRYFNPDLIEGPRIAGYPYGLVLKVTPSWLDDNNNNVYNYCDPDELRTDGKVVTVVTSYGYGEYTGNWATIEGTWNSGSNDYLPYVYVVLENVSQATRGVHIDRIEIREDLGGGQYGPCINGKAWMAHHYYMDQHKSWAFDRAVELAEQYDIYLKLVLSEKNEWIGKRIAPAGYISDVAYADYFYGEYRTMTKGRWLQQAWWRYCQARWGYSTHIHSWEVCNEGDPWSGRLYALTDEMGIYMHQFKNRHLVTTSFWHSFPKDGFWANAGYPNVDYADLHRYDYEWEDTAQSTRGASEWYGAKGGGGAGKPLIRGETGFFPAGVTPDSGGIWLHNFAWGTINHGGMYDLYWDNRNEFNLSPDPRRHYRPVRNFLEGIGLNNGLYADANAVVTGSTDLRAWGQRDLTNGNAHLWIHNAQNTWYNIVHSISIPPVSGTVDIGGFVPGQSYWLQWWDTYQPDIGLQVTSTERIEADAGGNIRVTMTDLATDVGAKILSAENEAPLAEFTVDKNAGYVPLEVNFDASGSWDPLGTIVSYEWDFDDGTSGETGVMITHTFADAGVYTVTLTVTDDGGMTDIATAVIIVEAPPPPIEIPGRLEVEDYRVGGEGIGYHDTTSGNSGDASQYTDDIDVSSCSDTGGTFDIGYIAAGEWAAYDVDIAQSGAYDVVARVSTAETYNKTLHLQLDGVNVAGGAVTFNTGGAGWEAYQDVLIANVQLIAGRHDLRIVMDTGNFNINYLHFTYVDPGINQPPLVDAGSDEFIRLPVNTVSLGGAVTDDGKPDPPAQVSCSWSKVSGPGEVTFADAQVAATTAIFSQSGLYVLRLDANDGEFGASDSLYVTVRPAAGTVMEIPGRVEAEEYKAGGEGVGYHDTTPGNQGTATQFTDDVDVTICAEGGFNIGKTAAGEWLAYDVNIAQTASYDVTARVATTYTDDRYITVQIDGNDVATFVCNDTGGWTAYADVTVLDVTLPVGSHELRVVWSTNGIDLNYLDIRLHATGVVGDLDSDGNVDSEDLRIFATWWLWTGAAGSVNADITPDGTVNFVDYNVLAGECTADWFIAPGDINGDGSVDCIDLGMLASQWLWTGTAGAIDEDIIVDGNVDFLDFAALAAEWSD